MSDKEFINSTEITVLNPKEIAIIKKYQYRLKSITSNKKKLLYIDLLDYFYT